VDLVSSALSDTEFLGYRRPDGTVGVRNHVLLLPTITCANQVAQNAAALTRGAVYVTHQHGCGQTGDDLHQTMRTFVGYGSNPNVYGVVVCGLGCEAASAQIVAEGIARRTGKPVELVLIQEAGGTLRATEQAARAASLMLQDASEQRREPCPVSELILGTECGGSDACSGISANPAVGHCADMLIDRGGTVLLAETTELIGAEHLLAQRAVSPEVAEKVYRVIDRYERAVLATGYDMRGGNPAPGNIAGGITTIEEKSLGAAHKGGTRPLVDVIPYGQRPTKRGLVWMDTPGHDIEQLTGMLAGGAQVVLFTTGRGTATGSCIAPVIKIATNTPMFERMRDNMDFNAGGIIDRGESIAEVGERLYAEMLRVCSGRLTRSEVLGHHEFGLWRIGPTL
jgi:altronate dehydratase large subunit